MTEITTSSISLTPLGLPGRLIIKQPDLTPDTHLLNIDIGVFSKVLILIGAIAALAMSLNYIRNEGM